MIVFSMILDLFCCFTVSKLYISGLLWCLLLCICVLSVCFCMVGGVFCGFSCSFLFLRRSPFFCIFPLLLFLALFVFLFLYRFYGSRRCLLICSLSVLAFAWGVSWSLIQHQQIWSRPESRLVGPFVSGGRYSSYRHLAYLVKGYDIPSIFEMMVSCKKRPWLAHGKKAGGKPGCF